MLLSLIIFLNVYKCLKKCNALYSVVTMHNCTMKKLFLLIFSLGLFQLNAQTFDAAQLLGTWELQSTEDDADDDLPSIMDTGGDEPTTKATPEITLFFQANNVLDLIQSGSQYKAQYQLQDSALFLGTTEYRVLELTSAELVLINENELFPTTYNYARTDKKVEPIKEVELIEEFYSNGQLKIQGTNVRGFRSGIWTEWYENGNVKSVSHFNNEALLMKVEFDEDGKVTAKTRLNFQTGEHIRE